jgi:hypothetical protein
LPDLAALASAARASIETPATPAEMGEIFKRLSLACRGQPGEQSDKRATIALYLKYLSGYSASVLSAAADEWISTQVFMPVISEMKKLCEAHVEKMRRVARRADSLADYSRSEMAKRERERAEDERLAEDRARRTPEWWAEMAAKREAIVQRAREIDPKLAAIRARMSERREQMRDELTKMNKASSP